MLLKVMKVKGCTCGPGAEWSSLDLHSGSCIWRESAQLLLVMCTCYLVIVTAFIHSLNKYGVYPHMLSTGSGAGAQQQMKRSPCLHGTWPLQTLKRHLLSEAFSGHPIKNRSSFLQFLQHARPRIQ